MLVQTPAPAPATTSVAPLEGSGRCRPRRSARRESAERLKKLKSVHFANTNELETCQPQLESHYPTPVAARVVPQNGTTTRRYTIDEVELYFSEDRPECPVSSRDYAVQKAATQDGFMLCGFVETRRVKMGLTMWSKCWAELHRGILMLRRYKEAVERKRVVVPVSSCRLEFLDFRELLLQVDYLYQGHSERTVLRFQTKSDMFLWWWSIQVAARVPLDPKGLHKSMSRSGLSPFQLKDHTYQVDNVLFPKYVEPSSPGPKRVKKPRARRGVIRIIFIRHGETENINFRVCDRDKRLTKRGEEEAEITAKHLDSMLKSNGTGRPSVTLIYGGLRRTVETAAIFAQQLPWIERKHECCFLEDGAPKNIDSMQRFDYRESMHKMAFEAICRWDGGEGPTRGSSGELESYRLVVAHTSFIQFCLARCYGVPKEIVQLGAPIAHCSLTQMDVGPDDEMTGVCSNRVRHLPLTHQTSE